MNLFNTYLLLTIYTGVLHVLIVGVFLFVVISIVTFIFYLLSIMSLPYESEQEEIKRESYRKNAIKVIKHPLYILSLILVIVAIALPNQKTIITLIALRQVDKGIEYSLTSLEEYKSINPESLLKDDVVWSTIDNILKTINEGE